MLDVKRLVPEGESVFDMVMKWKAESKTDPMFNKDDAGEKKLKDNKFAHVVKCGKKNKVE